MSTSTLGKIVIGILALAAIYGAYQYPQVTQSVQTFGAVGATFNTAKIAAINWTLSDSATSTSILNGDANDRIVEGAQYWCSGVGTSKTAFTGAGLDALSFSAATTSASAPAIITNTNFVLNTTVATSTATLFVASTSPGLTATAAQRIWASGSYLTFWSNATNTAACNIGVQYLAI